MTLKIDVKFEEKLICCFKNDLFQKHLHFHWFLLCKVFKVWPKKVQRSYLSWQQRVIQNLKKNWLVVWKMKWGIWQIFTRVLESLKIGSLMGYLKSRKSMSLKFTKELCVMTMKNDAKYGEESTCRFKIDMRNLTNFDLSTRPVKRPSEHISKLRRFESHVRLNWKALV